MYNIKRCEEPFQENVERDNITKDLVDIIETFEGIVNKIALVAEQISLYSDNGGVKISVSTNALYNPCVSWSVADDLLSYASAVTNIVRSYSYRLKNLASLQNDKKSERGKKDDEKDEEEGRAIVN